MFSLVSLPGWNPLSIHDVAELIFLHGEANDASW